MAQRVRSPEGNEGINGALYLNRVPRSDPMWQEQNLDLIPAHTSNDLTQARVDIAPGGNLVLSYLDIVGPDDLAELEIISALKYHDNQTNSLQTNVQEIIATRFSLNMSLVNEIRPRFNELREIVLDLYRKAESPPRLEGSPFVIHIVTDSTSRIFKIDEESKKRLIKQFGPIHFANITIPVDVESEYVKMHGEIYLHIVEWVTTKPLTELLPLGGVRFVSLGKVVWEYPRSSMTQQRP